jgi:anaerobic ribonucleoside-triphosphate reductase activating protein
MGGEPLCQENLFLTTLVIKEVRAVYPNIKIYLWTGYTIEELKRKENNRIEYILNNIDCLIDGPFIQKEKDTTLQMRGSRNQRIIYLTRE